MAVRTNNNDETTAAEVVGLVGGVGIVLMQAAAVIPGLLPILLLLLPLVLPLVVLGLVVGIVVGLPYGLWRLSLLMLRPLLRRRSTADPLPRPRRVVAP
jgi:hypothetical protein